MARRLTEEEDVGDPPELLEQVPREEREDVVLAREDLVALEDPPLARHLLLPVALRDLPLGHDAVLAAGVVRLGPHGELRDGRRRVLWRGNVDENRTRSWSRSFGIEDAEEVEVACALEEAADGVARPPLGYRGGRHGDEERLLS